jgi:hypothetical protein
MLRSAFAVAFPLLLLAPAALSAAPPDPLVAELVARYGEAERARVERGLAQLDAFWRAEDGDRAARDEFARTHFAGDAATRDALFDRLEAGLESLDGHLAEISRDWRAQSDLDRGPILPFDEIMAAWDPAAHVSDDLFGNKLAFAVLLNFPLTTLDERLARGESWSRREWAEARLAERFAKRIPSAVNQAFAEAASSAAQYVAGYNIWMHHLVDERGERLFPPKLRLLEHWNLRDEIKASYGDAAHGLARQRTIQKVFERIVDQSIPEVVIDNPRVDWDPFANRVAPAAVRDDGGEGELPAEPSAAAEPATRYATILAGFRAARLVDPYSPTAPTLIARRFDEDREIPEARVRAMFEQVLGSPHFAEVAALVRERLGRPLEPFDVWYNGFRPRGAVSEAELDALVRSRYPTAEAYARDMPRMLVELGFRPAEAAFLANKIVVDPARGSGHALGAERRDDNPHLRTRVGADGMDYKGFNIAVHEMGHNVEQIYSLNRVDHTLLAGVPNTAFTEALAFVFQAKDLELLGLAAPTAESRALKTLGDFWSAYEMCAVGLVDMGMWHWMYEHPDATPGELRDAVVGLAKETWNRYYAPVFGQRDVVLLGVYAHMVDSFMYLPDYAIGRLIAQQIEQKMAQGGRLGDEFERMAKMGRVTPDLWMKNATGQPVSADALLEATGAALETVRAMPAGKGGR